MSEGDSFLKRRLTRRKALSTAAKVAISAVVAGVVAGVGGYYAGSAAVPPPTTVTQRITERVTETAGAATVTKTVTETKTVTQTVTVTSPAPTVTATPTKKITIGYITRLAVPWWIIAEAGFRKAAKECGFEPKIYHPAELTVTEQIRVMEEWIAGKMVDGILVGPNDPSAIIDVINRAIDAGIPVLCGYGVDSPNSNRLLYLGYDAYKLGVALGKGALALLKIAGKSPPGRITYHTGGMASSEDVASWEGFKKTVEAEGWTVMEPILDEGNPARATALAEQAIDMYSDLVLMLGYYDYTGPALGEAVTRKGKIGKIIVHADGLIGGMIQYFKNGAIWATIELNQFDGSYIAGKILYELALAGKDKWEAVLKKYVPDWPKNKTIDPGFGWVTREKFDVKPWPELAWIKTLDEYAKDYPEAWKVITATA
jgi:ABC-type sugar transport system substrate-binding protein